MNSFLQYAVNLIAVADRVVNTVLGGDPRQTLSSRMGRDIEAGRCRACGWICAGLSLIQGDHCARSWARDQEPFEAEMTQVTGD